MTIYEALQDDHRKFEDLLDRILASSKAGNDQWKSLLDELRSGLIPHAHAEEAVFYNALREHEESKGAIAHSYQEHLMAETELRTLGGMKVIDLNWTNLVERLRKDLRHHIQEEEGKVFTAARKVLSEEEATQIGAAFTRLKPEMQRGADSLVASTLDLISNLLPARFRDAFRRGVIDRKKKAA
jgi:hemerythrin superfamily protein